MIFLQGRVEQRILMDNYETARRTMERSAPLNCVAVNLLVLLGKI